MSEKEKKPEETFRTVPNVRPFTKYRAAELAVCGFCVILGALYLYAHILSLSVLLPVYAVCFCALPVLQCLDVRAGGKKGFVNYLPALFWGVLALAVAAATVMYFVKG
ncbi:MAG: hypothetical protein ACI4V1_03605 [Eubacteriales bacterium]